MMVKKDAIQSINEPDPNTRNPVTGGSINEPVTASDLPPPSITSLSPDNCRIGEADFTLDVIGENFFPGSVIFFAGHDEPTTFNDVNTVSTGVKPSLWGSPAVVQCQVRNGSVLSNAVDFTFSAAEEPAP